MLESRYAKVERERRFFIRELPEDFESWPRRRIDDHYITGTTLRLRRVMGDETVFKLGQKLPIDGSHRWMTTMYLTMPEYQVLRRLPGKALGKDRMGSAGVAIDCFEGNHEGLMIAEFEFGDDESMESFAPPSWVGEEITGDEMWSGAELAKFGV